MKPGGQRRKGHDFERRVADDLREIYDAPELVAALRKATPRDRPALLKRSQVRRGEQAHGALEPDVVIPAPWWVECGDGKAMDPHAKLLQAQQDAPQGVRAVSVVHRKGSRRIVATMAASAFWQAMQEASDFAVRADCIPVSIRYEDWLALLRSARRVEVVL